MVNYLKLFDSTYLRAVDLNDKPALIRIKKIDPLVELMLPGGKKAHKSVLHYEQVKGAIERDKPLVLNRVNGDTIALVLNDQETENWIGQEIVLHPTQRMLQGRPVPAIGVRARKDK